ncbi:MAG TPA: DUF3578 domain-containing protein [Pasteurellaceae bacterium]|nr:DUF3578 domain-containing protein [Pasteurellaceae bacterium]
MNLQKILQSLLNEWSSVKNAKFGKGNVEYDSFRYKFEEFKEVINQIVKELNINNTYQIDTSFGQGNWADVAWLSILDTDITKTTQAGVYPVYLIKADASGIYLSLIQGSTLLRQNFKPKSKYLAEAKRRNRYLLERYHELEQWGTTEIYLNSTTEIGKSYEDTSIITKYYPSNEIPDDESLAKDLVYLLKKYDEMKQDILNLNKDNPLDKVEKELEKGALVCIPKPFLLLAGISGSGKTRFVREQAKITGLNGDNYCLVPVRPDWHEPSDLLGYVSRLSGKSEYIVTDLLKFIVKAWKEIAQAVSFEGKFTKGTEEQLQNVRPFWLCLDEMNLAPVEQYFADYLSILETREWGQDEDGLTYCSDSLLSKNLFSEYSDNAAFKKALGLTEEENDQKLLAFFEENGIPLPFNLIVAGTVNMDETTHGFSRKVLDRALSFDFSEFYPNDFKQFFKKETQPVALTYPYYSSALNLQGELEALSTDELNVTQKSIEFLSQLNQIFENTPFKLAYRALNELLLNVVSFQPKSEAELQAVWDDFLMFKVLPRLEGDTDKLAFDDNDTLLDKLISVLDVQLSLIWDNERVDFLNIAVNGDKIANIKCRSRQKLQWMKSKLESSYFTAFWQ